jgi:hypothetical protein
VNVRRLFIFLKESIDEGTQLTVFEASHEQLRDGAPQTSTFLSRVWRELRARGTTPRTGVLREVQPDYDDQGRHRQRSAHLQHRRRPRDAGGISDPLGGRRFVESEPGRGTTVRGELPAGSPL